MMSSWCDVIKVFIFHKVVRRIYIHSRRVKMYSPLQYYGGIWLVVSGSILLVFSLQLGNYISKIEKAK